MAKILVVDDRATNREYLVSLLGHSGHTIVEAADGKEALDRVRDGHPDLVITDILMPTMDGYEFVRQIRTDPPIAKTRVIFYTAHYLERDAWALAERCGVLRIVVKPVEPGVMLRTVEELLREGTQQELAGLGNEFDREHLRLVTDKLSVKSDELSRANIRLEALLGTTCALASNRDPLQLLLEYCHAARYICGARYAGAGIPQPDNQSLQHFVTSGLPAGIASEVPALQHSVFHGVLANVQPVRLPVTESNAGSVGLPANHPPVGSLLAVPIVSSQHVQGFLYLADKVGATEFDDADQKIAVSLAAQLAISYENARLFEEVQRHAAERELTVRKHAELERQFFQAQKMEAVGRLAGGVAHDFNNILTVILGYGRMLLEDGNLDPDGQEAAEEILKSADRASSLTGQLLAFSRSQILQPKLLTLNESVTNIAKMLERLIGEDVDLIHILDPDLGHVKADPGQIDQILINLVVNARDAMPDGGKITIETSNILLDEHYAEAHIPVQPGDYVMVAVSDTGQGMDAATKARLFEPFFTTKERGKGTGLGLSTVYGIVKQSEGNIWVYSEPGKGTTFKIYLPRVFGQTPALPVALAPRLPEQRGTVLVLEDEPALRRLTVKILKSAGYQVYDFGTPEHAIAFSARNTSSIDLLITDLVLPHMDGFRAAGEIVRLRPGTRVLFMSGYTEHGIMRTQAFDQGTFFLAKPFTSRDLIAKVQEVLTAVQI